MNKIHLINRQCLSMDIELQQDFLRVEYKSHQIHKCQAKTKSKILRAIQTKKIIWIGSQV